MKWILIVGWVVTGLPSGDTPPVKPEPAIIMPDRDTCIKVALLNKNYQCWAKAE